MSTRHLRGGLSTLETPSQHCSMFANTHEILYTSTGRPVYPPGCAGLRAIMGNWSTDITPAGMCYPSHVGGRVLRLPHTATTHEHRLASPGLRKAFSTHDPLLGGR
jgi:hypothetical protein